MIINSVSAVLMIFILTGIGIFASYRKWVDRTTVQSFPKLIVNFSLPAQILVTFNKSFTAGDISKSGILLAAPLAALIISYVTARLFTVILKIKKERRGVFSVLFAFSNSVFIGFPVAQALFGDAGMPYATFYYLANTTLFWTLGFFGIKRDAQIIGNSKERIKIKEIVKNIFNIPVIFLLISLLLIAFNIKLPEIIKKPAELIGGLATPLSMLFIGCVLYDTGIKKLKMERDLVIILLGRFVLAGLIMFGACALFGLTGLVKNVYIIQMTLPSMTQTIIVSELVRADSDFAAKGMAWTTLLSLITIPAVMIIFGSV